jgi:hypothetical protein
VEAVTLAGHNQKVKAMKKCPSCGEDIPDVAPPPPAGKKRWFRWLVAVVVAVVGVGGLSTLYVLTHLLEWVGARDEVEDRAWRTWDPLISETMRADRNCVVNRTFYNGWHEADQKFFWRKADRDFFWSVGCADGREFVLQVHTEPDRHKTLDCAAAKALKVNCFETIVHPPPPR